MTNTLWLKLLWLNKIVIYNQSVSQRNGCKMSYDSLE